VKIYRHNNIEYWYDRYTRCWWAREVDQEGNQIGDAEHAYTRGEIADIVTTWESNND
jgi:hypothetical protein